MAGIELEMANLSKTPCIDGALAVMVATKKNLGAGEPTTGGCLEIESSELLAINKRIMNKIILLGSFCLGGEAWWTNFAPQFQRLTGCIEELLYELDRARKTILGHAQDISCERMRINDLMAILNNTRNQILASPLMDPAAAGILDTQTAGAAIARHNEQLKYLRNSVALLVMRINSYCFPLEQCLAGALIRGETGTAVSSATGDLSMPTEQLMGTSEALSEYAVELETQHCGSELLEEVEVTHGWFSARDSLPALSRFVKLHDSLLALVGQEIRLQAKNLGDAALRYLRTDAVSAELVSSAAANSPI